MAFLKKVLSLRNILFFIFVILLSWIFKESFTSILFSGKSFEGRSVSFQILLFSAFSTFLFLLFFLMISIFRKKFPKNFAFILASIDLFVTKNSRLLFTLILPVPFFYWLLVKNSWIGDDAFITMRVVDNFINGYGPVWNVGERVQVFTHPLWFLFLSLVYVIIKDPYQTVYWLSLIISISAIFLVLFSFAKTKKTLLLACLLISASMAFVDYSSSGLENPLSHLLLIIMLIIALKQATSYKSIGAISLLAALSAVNRLDTILFYIPILIYQFYELRIYWRKTIPLIVICFSPLIAWETFSILYFGFPFPNTYYAKVGSLNLPIGWFFNQAWEYIRNSLEWDPITLTSILISTCVILLDRNIKKILVLLGMMLYFLYIFSIGGDFMSGRFFSALFLCSVILLLSVDYASLFGRFNDKSYYTLFLAILFVGLASDFPPIFTKASDTARVFDKNGIANERLYYFASTNWISHNRDKIIHDWGSKGIKLKNSEETFVESGSIGFLGYYAGPGVYIMDTIALSDPFRARIPTSDSSRVGHIRRDVPPGYESTIRDNFNNHILDNDLHLYYDKLSVLIHGDVFAAGRLQEILNFNLGKYDHLVDNINQQ